MTYVEAATVDTLPAVSLEQRRDTLYARLDTGFEKIERAVESGQNVAHWEQVWVRLLREYQDVCDQIQSRQTARASSVYQELAINSD